MSLKLVEFYDMYGNPILTVTEEDPNKARLTLAMKKMSATISWHQARDLHEELGIWLMEVAHLAAKEN